MMMFKFDSGMYAAGERENLYAFIIIECLPVVTESESESMPSLSVTSLSMPLAWPGLWENSPGPVLRRAHSLVMPEPCGRRTVRVRWLSYGPSLTRTRNHDVMIVCHDFHAFVMPSVPSAGPGLWADCGKTRGP
jgi:hypothetical protein